MRVRTSGRWGRRARRRGGEVPGVVVAVLCDEFPVPVPAAYWVTTACIPDSSPVRVACILASDRLLMNAGEIRANG